MRKYLERVEMFTLFACQFFARQYFAHFFLLDFLLETIIWVKKCKHHSFTVYFTNIKPAFLNLWLLQVCTCSNIETVFYGIWAVEAFNCEVAHSRLLGYL